MAEDISHLACSLESIYIDVMALESKVIDATLDKRSPETRLVLLETLQLLSDVRISIDRLMSGLKRLRV